MSLPSRARSGLLAVTVLVVSTLGGTWARAGTDGPIGLVVNTDDPAFSWTRVQRAVANSAGLAIIALNEPDAADRRGLLTVTWRPSRHELAVTYESARGTISRVIPGPDEVADAVDAAAALAVNLVRDQVAELLGTPAAASAAEPPPTPAATKPSRPRSLTTPEPIAAVPIAPAPGPAAPRFMIALRAGTGIGYASGNLEVAQDLTVDPGLGLATAGHLVPAVGVYVAPNVLISAEARLQFLTRTNDLKLATPMPGVCGGGTVCAAPRRALAGFVKLTGFAASDASALRPYVSGILGGGQIRYPVALDAAMCGPSGMERCVDSTRAGPIYAGAGVGVHYRVLRGFDVVAGVELLGGLPHWTFNLDGNVGAALSF